MKPIRIDDVPKAIRKKIKAVTALWCKGDINRLRKLRESSKNFQILIYHHSQGTDSYYHDIEKRYYTWAQIESLSDTKLNKGEHFSIVVIPYRAGVIFHSSLQVANPSIN